MSTARKFADWTAHTIESDTFQMLIGCSMCLDKLNVICRTKEVPYLMYTGPCIIVIVEE
jgi:hypothetical protein